jgi:hypothetical protein
MIVRTRGALLVAAFCLASVACTSPGSRKANLATRNLITADDIKRVGATTALEAIQRLQPNMLEKKRGPSSINFEDQAQIMVYVDGSRLGGIEALTLIQSAAIVEIRFLSASEATIRYGTGNAAGAIVITTKT